MVIYLYLGLTLAANYTLGVEGVIAERGHV